MKSKKGCDLQQNNYNTIKNDSKLISCYHTRKQMLEEVTSCDEVYQEISRL